jgi:hypothetical protein
MADPVTMAVVGSMAGAAMSPKDPLKGALLGAVGGYGGGAMLGSMGTAATTAANTVGATGGGFAGGGYGSVGLAGQTAAGSAAAAPSGFLGNTMAGLGKDFSAVQAFAKENPLLTQQAGGMATNLLFPEQQPMSQGPGIIRGQQMAQQQPQYNPYAAPNISLI